MKIYLAARYTRREELLGYAVIIEAAGHEVVSRWVFDGEVTPDKPPEYWAEFDLSDVRRADVVLSFTQRKGEFTPGGGRHVEFGYGLALKKIMINVGGKENIFHHRPNVYTVDTLEQALEFLGDVKSGIYNPYL